MGLVGLDSIWRRIEFKWNFYSIFGPWVLLPGESSVGKPNLAFKLCCPCHLMRVQPWLCAKMVRTRLAWCLWSVSKCGEKGRSSAQLGKPTELPLWRLAFVFKVPSSTLGGSKWEFIFLGGVGSEECLYKEASGSNLGRAILAHFPFKSSAPSLQVRGSQVRFPVKAICGANFPYA